MNALVTAAILAATLMAATPATEAPLTGVFEKGETLDYTVSWLRITGGSGRMTIAPLGDNQLRITSAAKSGARFSRFYKVNDQIESIVARSDFSTLRYTKRLEENGDAIQEVTTVEDGVATRVRKKVKSVKVPRPVLDPISVIYFLRTLELAPGKTHDLTLVADAKLYNVHAKTLRRETLQTPAGRFQTIVVEPRMESGGVVREEKMTIWYTDDDRRIPVRIRTEVKFGSVTATLHRMASGVGSTEPPALRGQ